MSLAPIVQYNLISFALSIILQLSYALERGRDTWALVVVVVVCNTVTASTRARMESITTQTINQTAALEVFFSAAFAAVVLVVGVEYLTM